MSEEVDLDKIAYILRDKHTKAASLVIDTEEPWDVYAGQQVDRIDMAEPILSGLGAGTFELPVDLDSRSYFRLVVGVRDVILAERLLPMEGAFNFRDLGGRKLKDGRKVKWGVLFRADELTNLTEADVNYLGSIPITSVIDFRAESEIKRAPDKLPDTAQFTYPMTITPGAMRTEGLHGNREEASFENQMVQMNRLYVSDPACIRAYRIMFMIIQNRLTAPIVLHCTAGKDRTGMGIALILFALGASEEEVMEDYMMSKGNIAGKYKDFVEKYPRTKPIFTVSESYLAAGIEQMKKDHGSIDNYLKNVLKVDIPKIRRLYLEPRR